MSNADIRNSSTLLLETCYYPMLFVFGKVRFKAVVESIVCWFVGTLLFLVVCFKRLVINSPRALVGINIPIG